MNLINDRDHIAKWVFDQFTEHKHVRMMPDFRALAVVDKNRILGAALFDCFYAFDCNVSIAIADKRCVTRSNLRMIFLYPFVQLLLPRISASVASDNQRSLALMERFGFKREGVKRCAFGAGADEILFGMLRCECPWL